MKKLITVFVSICISNFLFSQNPLFIPPSLTGTTFNLNIQRGSSVFYTGTSTPTYGINGNLLSPTLIVHKGDSVSMNVTNSLTEQTTLHWHGLHVSPQNDGGPGQIITPGNTWRPSFIIRNNAGTYWFHPHGAGKTERQVAMGIAGMLIVHDSIETSLSIPQTYGVDDIPVIVQTKEFDILQQIASAMDMDTAVFVNGTLHPYLTAPAQVLRLRLLNGSSMRSFYFGFSNGQTFYQISTDGGLKDTPVALTRLRLSPGERSDILVNLAGMSGQGLTLKSFSSGLPIGIYGSSSLGSGIDTIAGYRDNFLNGADFDILQINVTTATAHPITSIPTSLTPYSPYPYASAILTRQIVFDTLRALPIDRPNLASGPFGINDHSFSMDSINITTHLGNTEIWSLQNHTYVAHPFHIHNVQFNITEKSGGAVPQSERGWKDVVLVMPQDSAKFITRFADFSDPSTPYMYHCHLLHHEDDGMMGQYLVLDTATLGIVSVTEPTHISVSPQPVSSVLSIHTDRQAVASVHAYTISGQEVFCPFDASDHLLDMSKLAAGLYVLEIHIGTNTFRKKIIKE
jgi:bilirubin oxidase